MIRFRGKYLPTEIQILERILLFNLNYNKEYVIPEYPNLGMTPYDYLKQYKHQNIIN